MKKLDKLVLKSFISPFVLTTAVVVFIFLMRFLMLFFRDFVGKDLGFSVYLHLFGYFSLLSIPAALPLSVLLASLMCFGKLGEYFELTAIKSSGISVTRVLVPTACLAIGISLFSFLYNNYINPWANLKCYSLLSDIKTSKLTLNIREGVFYDELPGYRIKVAKKFSDGQTLKGIILYDHRQVPGNKQVIIADSGKMYSFFENKFLCLELYKGTNYQEFTGKAGMPASNETEFMKNSFHKSKVVLSLESFGLKKTDENQFKYHELMKNVSELTLRIDSVRQDLKQSAQNELNKVENMYRFHRISSKQVLRVKAILTERWIDKKCESFSTPYLKNDIFETALANARAVQTHVESNEEIYKTQMQILFRAELERGHKFSNAFACLVMFVIGASLGTLIKKGGFGIPVLLSICFFILMYVLTQLGDKYAKAGFVSATIGAWFPDFILLLVGVYFLIKAKNDAPLFDSDFSAIDVGRIVQGWQHLFIVNSIFKCNFHIF